MTALRGASRPPVAPGWFWVGKAHPGMDELWARTLIALLVGGAAAAVAVLLGERWRRASRAAPVPVAADGWQGLQHREQPPRRAVEPPVPPEGWQGPVHRCEQSVRRAQRAVEAISSERTRRRLRPVVRRMEAELPDVSALAELGRGLGGGPAADRTADRNAERAAERAGHKAADRVAARLDAAAERFARFTEQLLDVVAELVAAPGPDLVDRRAAELREQFPLTSPLSAVLAPQG